MSRVSGTTPEYAVHCESVLMQNCWSEQVASLATLAKSVAVSKAVALSKAADGNLTQQYGSSA